MNSEGGLKIFDYLSSKGKGGATVLTIARKTQMPISEVKKYVQEFPKSFVRIGLGPKYAINFSKLSINRKKALISEIEEFDKRKAVKTMGAISIAIGFQLVDK